LEHLDEALVLGAVLVQPLQLVAGGPERAARRVAEARDRLRALGARVDQVLGQRADDAVAPGVDLADLVAVLARGLDHAARACVDHGRDAAGLRIEGVSLHSGSPRTKRRKDSKPRLAFDAANRTV